MRLLKREIKAIQGVLNAENGRDRARLLDIEDVKLIMGEAVQNGMAWTTRETFAGSYRGDKDQTQCLVFRYGQTLFVRISRQNTSIATDTPWRWAWKRAGNRAPWTSEDMAMLEEWAARAESDDRWVEVGIR